MGNNLNNFNLLWNNFLQANQNVLGQLNNLFGNLMPFNQPLVNAGPNILPGIPSIIEDGSAADNDLFTFAFGNNVVTPNAGTINIAGLTANAPFIVFTPIAGTAAANGAATIDLPKILLLPVGGNVLNANQLPALIPNQDYTFAVDPVTHVITVSLTANGVNVLQAAGALAPDLITKFTLDIVVDNGADPDLHDLVDITAHFVSAAVNGGGGAVANNALIDLNDNVNVHFIEKYTTDGSAVDAIDKLKLAANYDQDVIFNSNNNLINGGSVGFDVSQIVGGETLGDFVFINENVKDFDIADIQFSAIGNAAVIGSLISGVDFAAGSDGVKGFFKFTDAGLAKLTDLINQHGPLSARLGVSSVDQAGQTDLSIIYATFAKDKATLAGGNGGGGATTTDLIDLNDNPETHFIGKYSIDGSVNDNTDTLKLQTDYDSDVLVNSTIDLVNGGSLGFVVSEMTAGKTVGDFVFPNSLMKNFVIGDIDLTSNTTNQSVGKLISGTDFMAAVDQVTGQGYLKFTDAGIAKLTALSQNDVLITKIEISAMNGAGEADKSVIYASFGKDKASLTGAADPIDPVDPVDPTDVLIDANDIVQTSYLSKAFWDSASGLDSQDTTKIFLKDGIVNNALYEKASTISPTGTMVGVSLGNLVAGNDSLLTFVNGDSMAAFESLVAPSLIDLYKSDGTTMVGQMIKGIHYKVIVDAATHQGTFVLLEAGETFLKDKVNANGDVLFKLKLTMVDTMDHHDEVSSYFYVSADKPAAPASLILDANDTFADAANPHLLEKAFYDIAKTSTGDYDDMDTAKIKLDPANPNSPIFYEKTSTISPTGKMVGVALNDLDSTKPLLQFVNDNTMKAFDSLLVIDKLKIFKSDGTTEVGELIEGTHYTVSMDSTGKVGSFTILPAGEALLNTLMTANGDLITHPEFTLVEGADMHDQFSAYIYFSANKPNANDAGTPPVAPVLLDVNDDFADPTNPALVEKTFFDSAKLPTGDFDDFDKAKIIKPDANSNSAAFYEVTSTISPTGTMLGLALDSLNTANPVFQFVNDNTMKVFDSLLVADKLEIFKSDGVTSVGELVEGTHYTVSMDSAGKVGSFMMLPAGAALLQTLMTANGDLITKAEFTLVEGVDMHDQFATYIHFSAMKPDVIDNPTQFSIFDDGQWMPNDFAAEISEAELPASLAADQTFSIGKIMAEDQDNIDASSMNVTVVYNGGDNLGLVAGVDFMLNTIYPSGTPVQAYPVPAIGGDLVLTDAGLQKIIASGALNTGQSIDFKIAFKVEDQNNGPTHSVEKEFVFKLNGTPPTQTATADPATATATDDTVDPTIATASTLVDDTDASSSNASALMDMVSNMLQNFQSLIADLSSQGAGNSMVQDMLSKLLSNLNDFAEKFGVDLPELDALGQKIDASMGQVMDIDSDLDTSGAIAAMMQGSIINDDDFINPDDSSLIQVFAGDDLVAVTTDSNLTVQDLINHHPEILNSHADVLSFS